MIQIILSKSLDSIVEDLKNNIKNEEWWIQRYSERISNSDDPEFDLRMISLSKQGIEEIKKKINFIIKNFNPILLGD